MKRGRAKRSAWWAPGLGLIWILAAPAVGAEGSPVESGSSTASPVDNRTGSESSPSALMGPTDATGVSPLPVEEEGSGETLVYSSAVDLASYEAVDLQPLREEISAPLMVSLAYVFMWLMVVIFVGWVWRRLIRVDRELVAARRRLEDLGSLLERHRD